jgi:hypothetical protein
MKDYQTNLLVERNGKRLLIDAGVDVGFCGFCQKGVDILK